MSLKRFFVAHLFVGFLAGFIMLVTNIMQGIGFITSESSLTFVTFIAWSCYFFSGCTPKDAVISWASFAVGIICAVIIFVCTDIFADLGLNVFYIALPLAVVVGVIFMDFGEKLPIGNRVSAIYLGAATYFGMMGIPAVAAKGFLMVGIAEMVYAALGFLSGYLTLVVLGVFTPKEAKTSTETLAQENA